MNATSPPGPTRDARVGTALVQREQRTDASGASRTVVVKALVPDAVTPQRAARLRHEFAMAQLLAGPHFRAALGLETRDGNLALVFEDCGGAPLPAEGLPVPTDDLPGMALGLARALVALHGQGLVHAALRPDCLLWGPSDDHGVPHVTLVDLADAHPPGQTAVLDADRALAWIAPEQTGRLGVPVDARADLYTAGAILYALASGAPPFVSDEPVELLHAHVARQPSPLAPRCPGLDPRLDAVVLRLLAKRPEDRYQAATSLLADLEHIRSHPAATDAGFHPAAADERAVLRVPDRLYGRQQACARIRNQLDRALTGSCGLLALSGDQGCGSSALLDWSARQVQRRDGLVLRVDARSAFEQPPVLTAADQVVRAMLVADAPLSTRWQDRLQALVGAEGSALSHFLPGMEPFTGAGDAGANEAVPDAATALRLVFQAAAEASRLLLLAVDDADQLDSLQLADLLRTCHAVPGMVTVLAGHGAVVPGRAAETVDRISLPPLDQHAVHALLTDTLQLGTGATETLARLVTNRTGGVAQRVRAFLDQLAADGTLAYDTGAGRWRWDMDAVARTAAPSPGAASTRQAFLRLPPTTREVLSRAACIGGRFALARLAAIGGATPAELARDLRPALQAGMVTATSDAPLDTPGLSYRFSHGALEEEAYRSLDDTTRRSTHLALADSLLAAEPLASRELHAAARHLNAALSPHDRDRTRLLDAARINLRAATDALHRGMHQVAFKFAKSGLALLAPATWQDHDGLGLAMGRVAVTSAFQCGDFQQVDLVTAEARRQGVNNTDLADFRIIQVRALLARNRLRAAVDLGVAAAADLGLRLPRNPAAELLRWRLLPHLPRRHGNAATRQLQRLLGHTTHAAYYCLDRRAAALVAAQLALTRRDGLVPESGFGLASLAVLLQVQGRPRSASRAAQLARRCVANTDDGTEVQNRVELLLHGLVDQRQPLPDTLAQLHRAHRVALRNGDGEFGLVAGASYATRAFCGGDDLGSLDYRLTAITDATAGLRHVTTQGIALLYLQLVRNLRARAPQPERLVGDLYHEQVMLPLHERGDDHTARAHYLFGSLVLAVLFGDYRRGLALAEQAERLRLALRGSGAGLDLRFHAALASLGTALTLANSAPSVPAEDPLRGQVAELLGQARRWLRAMEREIQRQPDGAGDSRCRIVRAGLLWAGGQQRRALDVLERAAASARAHRQPMLEAMACEMAGKLALASHHEETAETFLRKAYRAWLTWGAVAKAQHLEQQYPGLLAATPGGVPASGPAGQPDLLDMATVLRASQALSSQIQPQQLQEAFLRLALEGAGAQAATLCLVDAREQLQVAATADVDQPVVRHPGSPLVPGAVEHAPASLLRYALRSGEPVAVDDLSASDLFRGDAYVLAQRPRSALAAPLVHRDRVVGALYLEHRELVGVFSHARQEVVRLLTAQAAISLENAHLYRTLEEARDQYSTLYNDAVEGLFRMTRDGRLLQANPAFARTLGFASLADLEAVAGHLDEVLFPDPGQRDALHQALDAAGEVVDFECEGLRVDGSRCWLSLNVRLLPGEHGSSAVVDGSAVDITERKRRLAAEQKSRVAEATMAAKSRFLAQMSHEIRTPINAILGFSQLLQDGRLPAREQRHAESVHRSAETLLALVNDVLDYSRIESGKLSVEATPFRLEQVLDEVEDLFSLQAEQKGLTLQVNDRASTDPRFPSHGQITGDPLRLKQVLINLVGNAVKFTASGGVDLEVAIEARRDSELLLQFGVSDSGPGIAEEEQARLFAPFEQAESSTTRRYGGSGLGLTIARELTRLMGGDISVWSEPGHGSVFSVLVRCQVPAVASDPRPRSRLPAAGVLAGRRLLIAEDNPINRQLISAVMDRTGASVCMVEDGLAAVAAATKDSFDAVLLDLHMPELDGFAACSRIRARFPALPILAVTADVMPEARQNALAAGFDAFISKPLDVGELLAALGDLLAAVPAGGSRCRAADPSPAAAEAAGAAPAPTTWGADLQVMDPTRALHHHHGNEALLRRLLGEFVHHYASAGKDLRALLGAADREAAARLAHSLAGVAGSFAAEGLVSAARRVEHLLEEPGGGDGSVDAALGAFDQALAAFLDDARQLASG